MFYSSAWLVLLEPELSWNLVRLDCLAVRGTNLLRAVAKGETLVRNVSFTATRDTILDTILLMLL
jgi:hypothetical protein